MKTIVSVQEIEELEVKPPGQVKKWLGLVTGGIELLAKAGKGWVTTRCPCCESGTSRGAFTRHGVQYVECTSCGTLYAAKRPGEEALRAWYRDSDAAKFWREQVLPESEGPRRDKIVLPRVQWVLDGRAEYAAGATRLVDISGNGRALLEELLVLEPSLRVTAAGITADLEGASTTALKVAPGSTRELPHLGPAAIVTAFDVFDRAPDLRALVASVHATLQPDGVLFATLPVASGFEVQTLWERSRTVLPPDKVNLPTIDGLMRLFASPDWELLELSTPGMFDVDMVKRAMEETPDGDWPRAVRALVAHSDAPARQAFTEYLQSQRLTSFARLVARRKS